MQVSTGKTAMVAGNQVSQMQGPKPTLQVDLADFVALTVPQKQAFLAGLRNHPAFSAILPILEAALTAEVSNLAPVSAAPPTLHASGMGYADVARVLDWATTTGRGNIDYWVRSTTDLALQVQGMAPLVAALATREEGALATRLADLAAQLRHVSANGRGDLHYWVRSATSVRDTAHNVAAQLRSLAKVGTASIPPKDALLLLAGLARTVSARGRGNIDYWVRVSDNAVYAAKMVGTAVQNIAQHVPDPDKTVLDRIGYELAHVSSGARGDLDYWVARAEAVHKEIHTLARSLETAVAAM